MLGLNLQIGNLAPKVLVAPSPVAPSTFLFLVNSGDVLTTSDGSPIEFKH